MSVAPIFYFIFQILLPYHAPNAIVPKSKPQLLTNDIKFVYLSFDDGPLNGTANCIDVCLNQKVPATFFEVGRHQARTNVSRALYNKISQNEAQFVIANHSYSHANSKYNYFYHHPTMAMYDFLQAQKSLAIKNNIARLPGNNAWNTTVIKRSSGLVKPLVHKLDSVGFNLIGWDVEWGFTKSRRPRQSPQKLVEMVDSAFSQNNTATKDHLVILMHDHMFSAPEDSAKLVAMISLLKANPKYQLRKLTQYPGLKNGGH
jgi:peptidoglycan/xylan/chitin deacetylase (PgdA/CDA1 family)